jgi:radical SAM superfamily enzyme YgiQ (UPF0313 family)
MINKRVAFLVFFPKNQRRENNSFEGNDNIGAKVIADTLQRSGINVNYVTPESAHIDADIVLVSLTSTHDIYAYLAAVSLLPNWQPEKRHFIVLAGGFGMQNPTAIRRYVDYCAFGRAHEWVVNVIRSIDQNNTPSHESLMDIKKFNPVKIYQGSMYPHEVDGFKEEFTGCPLKCKFCHYTYARKHQGSDASYSKGAYVQSSLTGGGSPEVTWDQLLTWDKKAGRIRVAIDGFSQRIRYLYGKRISNEDIINGINNIGSFSTDKATTLMVYNIVNFPGETEDDYKEFVDVVSQANPVGRVIVVIQSTPFRPSIATPMQWEPVNIFPDWSKKRTQVIVERSNLRVVHSFTLETPWTHLQSVIAERATIDDDAAINAILYSPKLKKLNSADALKLFARNFDINKYIAELDINGLHPAGFVSGYLRDDQIKKIAYKMRRQRNEWSN